METAETTLAVAEQAMKQGQARTALDTARAVLRTDPNCGRAHALVALAHTMMGDEPEARDAVAKALEIAPLDSRVRYHCYLALGRVGDIQAARAQLTYFTQLEPKNAEAKAMLGKLGGAVLGLPPLPRVTTAVWYDGSGHATTDSSDFEDGADNSDDAEPPPGPDVQDCPDCEKRTWKGWFCKHCGASLPRV